MGSCSCAAIDFGAIEFKSAASNGTFHTAADEASETLQTNEVAGAATAIPTALSLAAGLELDDRSGPPAPA